jgi:pyruvate/2-oxoglutarate dehydrogenase complex dihydrolipoamide acyltransferase (E2) component
MLVTIIERNLYMGDGGKRVERVVGEKVDYPAWYADSLIASGFAVAGEIDAGQAEAFEQIDSIEASLEDDAEQETDIDEVNATTAALRRAAELDLDIATVEGTGRDGKITKTDVDNAAG